MQQSIVKFIALSYRYCSTCFGALQSPSRASQTAVAASGFRMNVEVELFSAVVGLLVTFVSEGLLQHFPRFSSSFPEFEEKFHTHTLFFQLLNPSKPELNPICYLLALLAHHFLHVSRIRVKSLTIRLLMSYIYIWSTYS